MGSDVDDLFARIRAGRTEATSAARKALAPEAPSPDASGTGLAGAVGQEASSPSGLSDRVDPAAHLPGAEAADGPTVAEELAPGAAHLVSNGSSHPSQDLLRRRDEVTAHLESSLARKLKRALQDEQNSLLDRLRSLKAAPTPANVLPSIEEHPDRFVEVGRSLLEEAARAGAELSSKLTGRPSTPAVRASTVDDLAEELGRSIAEPLRQRLELAFRAEGQDSTELADALGAAYREWKTQRIEATARDQVAAAFSRGSFLALPSGTLLRWVVSAAEGPCPDCDDNTLAGDQPKGQEWPTGQLHPPAHPGCRCVLEAIRPA